MIVEPSWSAAPDGESGCELCRLPGGRLVARARAWRVVRVEDADFPAFYRVIWQEHVAELSELAEGSRHELMEVVAAVESVLLERLRPDKVNLASLGNMVPHLHWHIVARFAWDSHFPQPIWGPRQRQLDVPPAGRLPCSLDALDEAVAQRCR